MATAAFRREVDLPGGRVSDQGVGRWHIALRWSPLRPRRRQHAVDVLGDRRYISIRQRNRRHAALGPRAPDNRQNRLALLISEDDRRAQQVGTASYAAAQVDAMAGAAVRNEERLAAGDELRIARWPLLRREGG